MDALEAIHTRRSIRRYQDKPVSADLIQEIIAAAMMAPSAGNVRPWQFIVLTDPEVRDKVPAIHPHASMTPQAPVGKALIGKRVGDFVEVRTRGGARDFEVIGVVETNVRQGKMLKSF